MTVFTIKETEFGWEEIVAAAEAWGEWASFTKRTRQALSCLKLAAESGQLPSAKETREAATAFRYSHNLISAEDAQAWLKRWEMTVDNWMSYLRGQLLAERWADQLESIAAAHPVSDEAVVAVSKNFAVCSDLFRQWAQELAGRSAVAAESASFDSTGDSARELVARIETEFQQARQQAVTPQKLQAKIADHRLDWIRFDCRCLWFGDERAAREAAWCVTEDGLSLDEVAADARNEVRQWDFYLDEIDADVRPYFLAARQGDLLGPLKFGDAFRLFSLTEKKMPASDDPQIQQRAEKALLAGWMGQAINERVKWVM